jgi:hypothetical protein
MSAEATTLLAICFANVFAVVFLIFPMPLVLTEERPTYLV